MVSPVTGPKYLSVREHLRRRVTALPEQTLLPPEPVLCAEYGVSRITLRRAVDGLVADGHLVREQGRGTYVTRPAIRHEYRESFVHRIAGFSSVMSETGAQVGTKVLTQRVVPVPSGVAAELSLDGTAAPDEADLLRIVAGSPLLVVRTTVRDSAGHPLVHSYSRLRPDVSQVEFEVSVGNR